MVRNRAPTKRNRPDDTNIHDAVQSVINKTLTLRMAAESVGMTKSTLARAVDKARKAQECGDTVATFQPRHGQPRIFNDREESLLVDYVIKASKLHSGLTKKMVREFAHEYACHLNRKQPENWKRDNMAGADWIYGFLKRHPRISVRTPEATSLTRATSFNKTNVQMFFNNLEEVMKRYELSPRNIYNMDETALTTVHKPEKILAQKNIKQVGLSTSAERGTLVTLVGCINAQGGSIPPFMIWPRVHFKESMLNGTPPESAGTAHPTGWMNQDIFLQWLAHFVNCTRCSKEKPVLLLMDNHISHISIAVINYAKENGVILLTFPPHCSHKLQPLDRSVYGPLKKYYNGSCSRWMINHPGRTISIHDIGSLIGDAYPKAFTPSNITSGFRVTGISPYNSDVFGEDEFLPSSVTDRPLANEAFSPRHSPGALPNSSYEDCHQLSTCASTSSVVANEKTCTPHELRPFKKAPPRKLGQARKRAKSEILTNTPVKERIETEYTARKKLS